MKKNKNQWFIKKFHRNKAVITIMHYPNKRTKVRYAIPEGENVYIDGGVYRCNTEKDYFSLLNGIPCFTYQFNKVEPVRIDGEKPSSMSADEYNTAINSKVVEAIFNATDKKMDLVMAIIIGLVATAIITLLGFFYMNDKLNDIFDFIKQFNESKNGVIA